MRKFPRLDCIVWALTMLLVVSCSSNKVRPPPDLVVRLKASAQLNPDNNNRPSPIVIKLYALSDPVAFANARFFELWENEKSILGDKLANVREYEVFPDQAFTTERFHLAPGTKFIGIVAAYRFMDRAVWRQTVTLGKDKLVYLNVLLGQNGVTVTQGTKKDGFVQ